MDEFHRVMILEGRIPSSWNKQGDILCIRRHARPQWGDHFEFWHVGSDHQRHYRHEIFINLTARQQCRTDGYAIYTLKMW